MYKKLSRDIKFIIIKSNLYYDKKRFNSLDLKKKRLSLKLNYIKLKLFKIKIILEKVIYRLKLLNYIKIYLIFYILLLESAL